MALTFLLLPAGEARHTFIVVGLNGAILGNVDDGLTWNAREGSLLSNSLCLDGRQRQRQRPPPPPSGGAPDFGML